MKYVPICEVFWAIITISTSWHKIYKTNANALKLRILINDVFKSLGRHYCVNFLSSAFCFHCFVRIHSLLAFLVCSFITTHPYFFYLNIWQIHFKSVKVVNTEIWKDLWKLGHWSVDAKRRVKNKLDRMYLIKYYPFDKTKVYHTDRIHHTYKIKTTIHLRKSSNFAHIVWIYLLQDVGLILSVNRDRKVLNNRSHIN